MAARLNGVTGRFTVEDELSLRSPSGVAMKERWERFLTATQAEKSRLKTTPTAVESFVAQGVDAIDMNVGV